MRMRILRNQSQDSSDSIANNPDVMSRDIALLERASESAEAKGAEGEIPELPEKTDEPEKLAVDEKEIAEELKEQEREIETPEESPVNFKTINDKYPGFFKAFPDFREIIGRHAELSKIFPNVSDAVDAYEKAEEFETLSDYLASGNISDFLNAVAESNKLSFEQLAEGILPYLLSKDQQLYLKITSPIIDHMIKQAYRTKNEEMQQAAVLFSNWVFGDEKYATGEKTLQTVNHREDPERKKLQQEKQEFMDRKKLDSQLGISALIERKVRTKTYEALSTLPDDSFIKRKIADDVWTHVQENLDQDVRHMTMMQTMWKRSERAGHSDEWKTRITTALLSRILPMLPGIRSKVVTEALGKSPQQPKEKITVSGDDSGLSRKKGGETSSISKTDFSKVDRSRTSDYDLLRSYGGDSDAKVFLKGK